MVHRKRGPRFLQGPRPADRDQRVARSTLPRFHLPTAFVFHRGSGEPRVRRMKQYHPQPNPHGRRGIAGDTPPDYLP